MRTERSDGAMGSQELAERAAQQQEDAEIKKSSADFSSSSCVVRWERFLSKMAVRVLLVEADDSTRQIIAALLRKCSYRVAAVGDGLKAWEFIKGRPDKIDLILTEVELPLISGYALLTLIMEHDACKNIPVIMMSSHDSISTVYKCMLRGATDFLVKPIRKNELRNLWQHLWRKQALSNTAGPGPPDESVAQAQPKIEATAENNALCNHSNITAQRNRECVEKGTDSESSCGKLELETEGTHIVTYPIVPRNEDYRAMPSIIASSESTQGRNEDSEVKPTGETSSMEAMDLIGTFDKGSFGVDAVSRATSHKFGVSQLLDLSLTRSSPSYSLNQNDDGRHRLNHSDASAFSRYVNKPLQPNTSTSPETCNQRKGHETNLEKQQSIHSTDRNPDEKHLSVAETRPEIPFCYPQKQDISHQIPSRGVRPEQAANPIGSVRSSLLQSSCPVSAHQSDHHISTSQQYHNRMDQTVTGGIDKTYIRQGHEFEDSEDQVHASPVLDQTDNNNICDETMCSGNNGKIKEEGFQANNDRASHRSLQREAALTKFRLKRKDRCFEKKVRYESRKKLAEQRPRVKGQFVRQAPNDPQPGNSSAD